ncbi:hypothetical protein Kisp01_70520 [Kineosporia sp. NBRC 101677]|nr:hypothetical protein Kisp01_70520 [Kineosporia sp. NBRC 101677]
MAVLTAASLVSAGAVGLASSAAAATTGKVTPGDLIVGTCYGGQSSDATPCWAFQIDYPNVKDMAVWYRTAAGDEGDLTWKTGQQRTQNSAGFCMEAWQRGVTDPMDMTFSLYSGGDHVADLPVKDAVATPSDVTAAALLHQINRLSLTDVSRMNLCVELGRLFPAKAPDSSVPYITQACLAERAAEGRIKLTELLVSAGAVAVWQTLYKMDHPDQDPSPGPCTTACPNPDPVDPDPVDPDPDPVPEQSERDRVIERILEKFPSMDFNDAAGAADTCLATQQKLLTVETYSGPGSPCLEANIFFPGSNAGGAAIHDRDVISANPETAWLTYRSPEDRDTIDGVPHDWYMRAGLVTDRRCVDAPAGDDLDCDEYPFYSTMEGGPGKGSLRLVPFSENRSEGASLKNMQNDDACNMATRTWGSGSTQYLVVPVAVPPIEDGGPYGGPRSFHICGNEKYPLMPPGWGIN